MRRLPIWMLAIIAVLTAALLIVGIDERHEIGPVPMILGVLWTVWLLATAPKVFSRD